MTPASLRATNMVAFFAPGKECLVFRSGVRSVILAAGTVVPTKTSNVVGEAVLCALGVGRNRFVGFLGLVASHLKREIQICEVLEVGFVFGVGDPCATARVPSRRGSRGRPGWQRSDWHGWQMGRWGLLPQRVK